MKKNLFVLMIVLALLATVSISAVSAEPTAPIECVLDITYDEYESGVFYWLGTLADCELAGTIKFVAVDEEYAFPGKTMHFVELFTIKPDIGGEITGKNWGVWNFSTLKFRANGWVLDASPEWEHLVGAKYHEMGTTTNPEYLPIFAPDGAMRLVSAERPSHALP